MFFLEGCKIGAGIELYLYLKKITLFAEELEVKIFFKLSLKK